MLTGQPIPDEKYVGCAAKAPRPRPSWWLRPLARYPVAKDPLDPSIFIHLSYRSRGRIDIENRKIGYRRWTREAVVWCCFIVFDIWSILELEPKAILLR